MAQLFRFKSKRKGNFAHVELTNVEDRTLSWKAKGIHLYIMSRPPEWTIRATDLIRRSTDGRDSLYSGLKELEKKKYLHRKRVYRDGKIVYWDYDVYEEPTEVKNLLPDFPDQANPEMENLLPENQDQGFQDQENPHIYYNNNISNKQVSKKKTSFSSTGNSCRSFPVLEFNFISDNGRPLAKDSWCGTYVLKTQAERPILNIVSRLSRQKVKPDPVAIEEVVNHWNSFADRCKHNDLQVVRHNLATSKTLYKIQVLVTNLLATGTTTNGIKKAIDNFEDLLLRSPHYSNNRRFSLPMFLIMPQSDPGRLFDDCLTGEYANSKKYFPTKYKKTLTYFVDLMINREKSANGYISDMTRRDIIDYLAPDEYLYYLMEKGGTREECRAIVAKERKKLLTYL